MSAPCSESPQVDARQVDAPPSESPRTVLLTRSAAQGAAFARALAKECAQNGLGECRVLFAPLQQARTVEPGADHAAALEALASGQYAWVSFTSANTVRACAELWGDKFARACASGGVRIACVGAATARAVHTQLGLGTDFQPQVQSAAGMLAEFEGPAAGAVSTDSAAAGPDSTKPAAVLVLEGSNARPTLREGLKNLGWDSRRCVLYDMVPAEQVAPGELSLSAARALVQGNAVDAADPENPAPDVLVVTAPSRLHALLDGVPALASESVPPESVLAESVPPVVAIGASTASACRALNLRYVQADSPSPQDLARAAVSLI